jgi:hypothetical protein
MSDGLITRGYYSDEIVADPLSAPTISNLTPSELTPGTPGAFSATYSIARFTPIEFDLTDIASGAQISIVAKFANRNETYVVLHQDGSWRWPFDAHSTIGVLSSEPVHVSILPRDGWPPVPFEFHVAAVAPAVEP